VDDSTKMSLGEIDCDVMNYMRFYMGFLLTVMNFHSAKHFLTVE